MTDDPREAPEASTAEEFHQAHNKGIGSFWVIVIVLGLLTPTIGLVVKWTNDSQDRQQAAYRRDQDARQAQYRRQLEAKFQQALAISSQQNAYSINKGVCGWRGFGDPILKRALKRRETYATLTPAERASNENVIKTTTQFLDNQVPVPPDFDCATLPKKPPKPAPKGTP